MGARFWPRTLALAGLMLSVAVASPATAATNEPTDPQILLAQLTYTNGLQAVFNRDTQSGDFGLVQTGPMNRSGPLVNDPDSGLLQAYLAITPPALPVPYLLLPPPGTPLPPGMSGRQISTAPVYASGLAVPPTTQASLTCWDLYWNSYNWYEAAGYPNPSSEWHDDKTYYVSTFYGSMKEFADSYVGNCGPSGVRHRVYYKQAGDYYKHHDATVSPGHWQAVHKGSVVRWRKVVYGAGFGYTRNGRFHN